MTGQQIPARLSTRPAPVPLYCQLLRLRHVQPNAGLRIAYTVGAAVAGALLALAGWASAWSVLILPGVAAVVVKAHDALAGQLPGGPAPGRPG